MLEGQRERVVCAYTHTKTTAVCLARWGDRDYGLQRSGVSCLARRHTRSAIGCLGVRVERVFCIGGGERRLTHALILQWPLVSVGALAVGSSRGADPVHPTLFFCLGLLLSYWLESDRVDRKRFYCEQAVLTRGYSCARAPDPMLNGEHSRSNFNPSVIHRDYS